MSAPARPTVVLLVAPLPPPRGGIGTWTESLLAWAAGREDVAIDLVDTAPRWRPVHDLRRSRRMVKGAGQAWRDIRSVTRSIARRRPDVLHLATSGGLALARDACLLLFARLRGIRSLYHLHLGWLPDTVAGGGFERAGFRLTLAHVRHGDRARRSNRRRPRAASRRAHASSSCRTSLTLPDGPAGWPTPDPTTLAARRGCSTSGGSTR